MSPVTGNQIDFATDDIHTNTKYSGIFPEHISVSVRTTQNIKGKMSF